MFLPLFSVFFTGTASSNTLLPRSIHTKREVTGSRSLRRYTCYSLKACSMGLAEGSKMEYWGSSEGVMKYSDVSISCLALGKLVRWNWRSIFSAMLIAISSIFSKRKQCLLYPPFSKSYRIMALTPTRRLLVDSLFMLSKKCWVRSSARTFPNNRCLERPLYSSLKWSNLQE